MKETEKNTKSKKKAVFLVLALVVAIAAVIAIIILASYPVNILEYKRNVKNSPIELSVHDITKTSLSYDVVNNTDYSSIETGTRYFILRKGLLGYKQFYDGADFDEIAIIIDKTQTLSIDWTDSIGELKAGKYLLVKEFSPLNYGVQTGKTYKVYAEFEIASEPIEVSEDFGGIVLSVSIDSDRYKPGESFVVKTSVVNNTDEDIYLRKEEDECELYPSRCTHTEMNTTIRKSESVSLVDKKVFEMAGKVPSVTFHKLEKGEK